MHSFDYDMLPNIVKEFIDKKFSIEMESEEDANKLTDYLNSNMIGWETTVGCFAEILHTTLPSHFENGYKFVVFLKGRIDGAEGVNTRRKANRSIKVKEFLKAIEEDSINYENKIDLSEMELLI